MKPQTLLLLLYFFEKPDQRLGDFIHQPKTSEHHAKLKGQYQLANHAATPEPQRLTKLS